MELQIIQIYSSKFSSLLDVNIVSFINYQNKFDKKNEKINF